MNTYLQIPAVTPCHVSSVTNHVLNAQIQERIHAQNVRKMSFLLTVTVSKSVMERISMWMGALVRKNVEKVIP